MWGEGNAASVRLCAPQAACIIAHWMSSSDEQLCRAQAPTGDNVRSANVEARVADVKVFKCG